MFAREVVILAACCCKPMQDHMLSDWIVLLNQSRDLVTDCWQEILIRNGDRLNGWFERPKIVAAQQYQQSIAVERINQKIVYRISDRG